MEKSTIPSWTQAITFVSDVYDLTKSFPWGESDTLSQRIRKTAVSLSIAIDSAGVKDPGLHICNDINPVLSLTSILETYIIMAGEHNFGRDIILLHEKVKVLKEMIESPDDERGQNTGNITCYSVSSSVLSSSAEVSFSKS